MKNIFTLRVLIIILLYSLLLFSCDFLNDINNAGDKIVTFSLNKINSTSFSVTLNGANWEIRTRNWLHLIFDADLTLTYNNDKTSKYSNILGVFDDVQDGSKVMIFTLKSNYTNLNGTISFNENGLRSYSQNLTDGGGSEKHKVDGTGTYYRADTDKSSITF